ncbi:hypothetical protein DPX16_22279 [Anabarilius grahami]|uniref:Uncharacterized protein n=1 Tax=Anabarilius grahami TaxID=495550 RepID=A0A3N0Y086_ANAGA|nr:hypothetical protein DPX16_22279 [Anabarilius grahami]
MLYFDAGCQGKALNLVKEQLERKLCVHTKVDDCSSGGAQCRFRIYTIPDARARPGSGYPANNASSVLTAYLTDFVVLTCIPMSATDRG